MTAFAGMLARAERHLEASCPHMRGVIERVGPCGLTLQTDGFQMLVRSITSQQISSSAARAIRGRLLESVAPEPLTPESVLACGEEGLRLCGYSGRKASYLLGLAREVRRGRLQLTGLHDVPDEEIVAMLTGVRGLGEWTAHMFLIFALGRPDVLPHGDHGVRSALRGFHGLEELPTKRQCLELARDWRPYASVASWYCWRSIDAPAKTEAS